MPELKRIEDRPCLEWTGGDLCRRPAAGWTHLHRRGGEQGECIAGWAYCAEHGGEERSQLEAREDYSRCWFTLAPPTLSLGRVLAAGAMGLSSEHAYIVLRPTEGQRWKSALGLWGHTRELPGSYPDQLGAERAGLRWWRREVEQRVAFVRAARGGTLDWGTRLTPPPRPRVLVAAERGPAPPPETARPPLPEALEAGPLVLGGRTKQRRALAAVRRGEEVYRVECDLLMDWFERAREIAPLPRELRQREEELLEELTLGDADAAAQLDEIYQRNGVVLDA